MADFPQTPATSSTDLVNPNNLGAITITADAAPPQNSTGGSQSAATAVITNGFCSGEQRISTEICNSVFPAVAFDGFGNIGIAWHDTRDGNFEIYTRFIKGKLDTNQLKLAQGFFFDPATGRAVNLSCSGFSSTSSFSGTSAPLVTQGGGQLDVNPISQTMTLTAGPGSKDFQSLGVTPNSSVSIVNGLNNGQTFYVLRVVAPNVLELIFVQSAKADSGFVYTITRADTGVSTPEVRMTCNQGASQFPDIIADSQGRFHVVFQDNSNGNYELYYTMIYPQSVGVPNCAGSLTPISSTGFFPVPNGTPGSITLTPPPSLTSVSIFSGTSLISYPVTGSAGAFFSFGNKALPDPIPVLSGPVLSRTGQHRLFKDFAGDGNWIGVSKGADRDVWNAQAAADGITVAPDYVAGVGNPFAAPGDFGTKFNFKDVAFIAQTPPDKAVSITQVALALKPRCLPPTPANPTVQDFSDLRAAPKQPVPPGFQDPVDLAEILQSPLVTVDQTLPDRFTVQGDTSGTVFTNITSDNGQGELSRFVFNCTTDSKTDQPIFILGQLLCGTEKCALFPTTGDAVTAAVNPTVTSQYKMTLQIWEGPDYRFIPDLISSAQMQDARLLVSKEFAFDPGEAINVFSFKKNEVVADDGHYIFFVAKPEQGVEFYIEGVGGGNAVWSTDEDGTFDQYFVPFTIKPNSGLNAPVYYEGYLRDATSGAAFYPPGSQVTASCNGLTISESLDIAFSHNFTSYVAAPTSVLASLDFPPPIDGSQASSLAWAQSKPTISQGFVVAKDSTLMSIKLLGRYFFAGDLVSVPGVTTGGDMDIFPADNLGNPTSTTPVAKGKVIVFSIFGDSHGFPLFAESITNFCAELKQGNYCMVMSNFSTGALQFMAESLTALPSAALGPTVFNNSQNIFIPAPVPGAPFTVLSMSVDLHDGPPTFLINGQPINSNNQNNNQSTTDVGPIVSPAAGTCWRITVPAATFDTIMNNGGIPIGTQGMLNVANGTIAGNFGFPASSPPGIFGGCTLLAVDTTKKTLDIVCTNASCRNYNALNVSPNLPFATAFFLGTNSRVGVPCNSIQQLSDCPVPAGSSIVCVGFTLKFAADAAQISVGQNGLFLGSSVNSNKTFKVASVNTTTGAITVSGIDLKTGTGTSIGQVAFSGLQFPVRDVNGNPVTSAGNLEYALFTDAFTACPGSGSSGNSSGGPDDPTNPTNNSGSGDISTLIALPPVAITQSAGDSVHPRLAIDDNDIIWCAFHSNRTGNNEVYVSRNICGKWASSANGGLDFKVTNAGANGANAQFPNIALDALGNAHVVWHSTDTEDGQPDIFYSRTTSGGTTFGQPQRISASSGSALMPDIAISSIQSQTSDTGCAGTTESTTTASSGRVTVVWHDNRFGQFEIMSAAKIDGKWDGSAQGGSDTRITQAPGDSLYPRIRADHHGNLRCVYHDKRRGFNFPWIFMSTFVSANQRWDSTGQAGIDMPVTPTGSAQSLFPDLDIDPLDGVYVVWHDTRFHTDSDPDTQEEIMGSYCSRLDSPAGFCGPICTNVEAFVTTIVAIVDPVSNKPITTTSIPQVGVQITSPGATFYRISENGGPFSAWTPFIPGSDLDSIVAQWTLSAGAGVKTICVQVQDAATVGFPVCKDIVLQSSLPQFRIGFFKNAALTVPLDLFKNHPVAPEGDIFLKISSSVPLIDPPTFDVISKGVRLVFNQQTTSVSGFSASASTLSGIIGNSVNSGVSGFSGIAGVDFVGRFHVHRDDGFFHIDGPARVIPHGKDIRGQSF